MTLFTLFNGKLELKFYWNGVAVAFMVDNYDIYIVIPFFQVTISRQ